MAYSEITNGEIDQDSPLTQELMTKVRDNPLEIADGTTGAPVNQAAWHPYDMVLVGDGADGVVYDHSVDGTVASIVSPDFEDDYQYLFYVIGISPSQNTVTFRWEHYRETDASYFTAQNISSTINAVDTVNLRLELFDPRISLATHFMTSPGSITISAQKLLRVRFTMSSGNIDAGSIRMFRRRLFS